MSVRFKDIERLQEDPTLNESPMGTYSTFRGVTRKRWIPQPSSGLICSLSALCTGLLFIIIILIVTITRQGVDQTEQNMEVKLRNLSLGVDSRVEKLSQDDSRMMEKLTDIQTFIKDMKDSRIMEKLTNIQTFIKDMKDSRMMEKLTDIETFIKDVKASSVITKINGMEESVNRILSDGVTDSRVMEKLTDIETFIKDMKGQGVDQTEKNMEVMIRNLSLGLDSRVEKLSQDDSRMMEKLTDIETYIKDMKGQGVDQTEKNMEVIRNLSLGVEKLSQDDSRMMEKLIDIETNIKDMKGQGVDQTEKNMEVIRNLSLGLDSRVEKLSQDDSRMMEKLTDIETNIKDMKGQGVDQTEKNMEVIRNLSLGLDSRVEKLSQDDSRMMEKLTDIETFIKDMKDAGIITKIKGVEASVNRILSDDVTGSLGNEIQRILEAIAGLRDEIRKGNSSTDPLCEVGWKHYGLSCYYFSEHVRSWDGAKKDCETKKAHLVVINGQEENTFLYELSQSRTVWVGLTDADGSWKWVDGTSYDATPKFWQPGQPDDWFGHGLGGGEDCAHLKSPKFWNDDHCSRTYPYICERKKP